MISDLISKTSPDFWLQSIPGYQMSSISALIDEGRTFEEAAEIWFGAAPENTAPFGAVTGQSTVYSAIKHEIYTFICDDGKYIEQKKEIEEIWDAHKVTVTLVIASAIGSTLGLAASALLPIVALIMATVAKFGKSVWCQINDKSAQ